ncbi:uncharacterized protein DKFZp434B061-like [Palaemon carinicauda]|uniref:uncharacterized protein DKFZp434B061-like n=1 Tax=Palaemon carinicauda TaxID=392227 RepID=UPI0035B68AF6
MSCQTSRQRSPDRQRAPDRQRSPARQHSPDLQRSPAHQRSPACQRSPARLRARALRSLLRVNSLLSTVNLLLVSQRTTARPARQRSPMRPRSSDLGAGNDIDPLPRQHSPARRPPPTHHLGRLLAPRVSVRQRAIARQRAYAHLGSTDRLGAITLLIASDHPGTRAHPHLCIHAHLRLRAHAPPHQHVHVLTRPRPHLRAPARQRSPTRDPAVLPSRDPQRDSCRVSQRAQPCELPGPRASRSSSRSPSRKHRARVQEQEDSSDRSRQHSSSLSSFQAGPVASTPKDQPIPFPPARITDTASVSRQPWFGSLMKAVVQAMMPALVDLGLKPKAPSPPLKRRRGVDFAVTSPRVKLAPKRSVGKAPSSLQAFSPSPADELFPSSGESSEEGAQGLKDDTQVIFEVSSRANHSRENVCVSPHEESMGTGDLAASPQGGEQCESEHTFWQVLNLMRGLPSPHKGVGRRLFDSSSPQSSAEKTTRRSPTLPATTLDLSGDRSRSPSDDGRPSGHSNHSPSRPADLLSPFDVADARCAPPDPATAQAPGPSGLKGLERKTAPLALKRQVLPACPPAAAAVPVLAPQRSPTCVRAPVPATRQGSPACPHPSVPRRPPAVPVTVRQRPLAPQRSPVPASSRAVQEVPMLAHRRSKVPLDSQRPSGVTREARPRAVPVPAPTRLPTR